MAINGNEQRTFGNIKVHFTDGTAAAYKDVTKVTYMQDDILVNFLSGNRLVLQRVNVKSVHSDSEVYVTFSCNGRKPDAVATAVRDGEKTFDSVRVPVKI